MPPVVTKDFVEWAANCPENFESRAALVGAELACVWMGASWTPSICTNRRSDRPA